MKTENKNLNLCELLKGCEGKKFYSRFLGDVYLVRCGFNNLTFSPTNSVDTYLYFPDGTFSKNGEQDIFPSKNQRNWEIWKNSKPKYWRADFTKEYYYIDMDFNVHKAIESHSKIDDMRYNNANYFPNNLIAEQSSLKLKELLKSIRKTITKE